MRPLWVAILVACNQEQPAESPAESEPPVFAPRETDPNPPRPIPPECTNAPPLSQWLERAP